MLSTSDLPACPACGCRAVHAVQDPPRTFYACMQCGRDQTEIWKSVQPDKRPAPVSIIGKPPPCEDIAKHPTQLGIAATVKS